jgi:hypothetical protein
VGWVAIECVNTPRRQPGRALREGVAYRSSRNIGAAAAARRQLEFVFFALRDGHVRALEHRSRVA